MKEKAMKELKLFVCETCGTQYADKNACTSCEAAHKKPTGIVECAYKSNGILPDGFPLKIRIDFGSGKSLWYKRY